MKQTNWILKVLLVIVIPAILWVNGYSYVAYNGAGYGYEGSNLNVTGTGICSGNEEIEYHIMWASGYYLNAEISGQQLLKAVEWQDLQGIDWPSLQSTAANALYNMNAALDIYDSLIRVAEITPYNEAVLISLKEFDYENFIRENNLNKELFTVVQKYLQSGDITGMFKYTAAGYAGITGIMETIKRYLDMNKLPSLSVFWQMNETMDHTSTIGSYVARVFAAIK